MYRDSSTRWRAQVPPSVDDSQYLVDAGRCGNIQCTEEALIALLWECSELSRAQEANLKRLKTLLGGGKPGWEAAPLCHCSSQGREVCAQSVGDSAQLCQAAGTEVQGGVCQLQGGHVQLRAKVVELFCWEPIRKVSFSSWLSFIKLKDELGTLTPGLLVPRYTAVPRHRRTSQGCCLSRPFDQVSWSLGDFSLQRACENHKDQMSARESLMITPEVRWSIQESASSEGQSSLCPQDLPAPRRYSSTQGRSLEPMAPGGGQQVPSAKSGPPESGVPAALALIGGLSCDSPAPLSWPCGLPEAKQEDGSGRRLSPHSCADVSLRRVPPCCPRPHTRQQPGNPVSRHFP